MVGGRNNIGKSRDPKFWILFSPLPAASTSLFVSRIVCSSYLFTSHRLPTLIKQRKLSAGRIVFTILGVFQITTYDFKFNSDPSGCSCSSPNFNSCHCSRVHRLSSSFPLVWRSVCSTWSCPFSVRIQLRMDGSETSAPFIASRTDPTLHLSQD